MRTIVKSEVGQKLVDLLDEAHPIERDIGIIAADGTLAGVIISKGSYAFFLQKIEEEQNKIDLGLINEFDQSGEADN